MRRPDLAVAEIDNRGKKSRATDELCISREQWGTVTCSGYAACFAGGVEDVANEVTANAVAANAGRGENLNGGAVW